MAGQDYALRNVHSMNLLKYGQSKDLALIYLILPYLAGYVVT